MLVVRYCMESDQLIRFLTNLRRKKMVTYDIDGLMLFSVKVQLFTNTHREAFALSWSMTNYSIALGINCQN